MRLRSIGMSSLFAGGLAAGFLKSWGLILVSEIGDKTFFIAAVMAMRNSRQSVRDIAAQARDNIHMLDDISLLQTSVL